MRKHLMAGAAAAALLSLTLVVSSPALAQDASDATVTDAAASSVAPDDATLAPDELDKLLAPVALYPDTLLTQILYASTFPLDVVKAGRFVDNSAEMADKDRASAVEATDWDPSVQALAAGFPTVVTRMNENIDWTETVGDAVLVQTDDVLNSVQRLREQAADTGYLTSNDAQVVEVGGDMITIAPANPEVVYVPAYDPTVVYTTPAPAQSVVYVDDGNSDLTDALASGAIIFGTAMILNEIFDDNDPWDNYWRGPSSIDWNNNDFHARPGINVGGGVNLDNSHNNNFANIDRDKVNFDRNRPGVNNDLVGVGGGRVGTLDRDGIDRAHDRSFKPDVDKRNAARDKMAARKADGGAVPSLRPAGATTDRPAVNRPAKGPKTPAVARPAGPKPTINRPAAAASKPAVAKRPANVSRPQAGARPAVKKPPPKATAFERTGGSRAGAASNRGRASAGRGRR